jgi:glycosyltransferase involved in cell wall biosynthesis
VRIRVLYLITELLPAGAERIVQSLATGLDPERFEVRVASLRSPGGERGDGEIAEELRAAGVPVVPLRAEGKLSGRAAARLAFELYTFRPHVIHAHLFHANLSARLAGRLVGAKIAATYHVVERRQLRLRRLAQRLTIPLEHVSVCVSEAVAAYARDALGVRAPRVIPNGIDLTRYGAPPDPVAARAAARVALDLPKEAFLIGAVGRLDPQKAPEVLLEAFRRLDDPQAILVYAGEGPLDAQLRAEASSLADGPWGPRVRFLGFRRDVPQVLDALDVFALPSRWEGFGLALAEALARGVPAIATRVDSLPQVMGEAGLLIGPDDAPALLAALEELRSAERRAELRLRGPLQAEGFGLGPMREAYQALYRELASS